MLKNAAGFSVTLALATFAVYHLDSWLVQVFLSFSIGRMVFEIFDYFF